MSESNTTTPSASPASANRLGYGPIKPLAVRLNESTRTQLDIIVQLDERTTTLNARCMPFGLALVREGAVLLPDFAHLC